VSAGAAQHGQPQEMHSSEAVMETYDNQDNTHVLIHSAFWGSLAFSAARLHSA
jgi:hypothetical protein